jgi:hypothetical protein
LGPPNLPCPTTPTPNEIDTGSAACVNQLYLDLLHRAADANGRRYWTSQLDNEISRATVVGAIMASVEYRKEVVDTLYQTLLNRRPDPDGEAYWVEFLSQGHTQDEVKIAMLSSPESLRFFEPGACCTPGNWTLDEIYQGLLGRAADPEGFQWWNQALSAADFTPQAVSLFAGGTWAEPVVSQFASSPEARQKLITGEYQSLLGRAPDSGGLSFWSSFLSNGHSTNDLIAALAQSQEFFNKAVSQAN